MQTVKGRTAVISGGSVGAKFEMVKQLLKDGVNVALLGHFAKATMQAVEEGKCISNQIIDDHTHKTEFVKTLYCFLQNERNISATVREINIHRNSFL